VQKQLQKGVVSFNQDILDNETSGSDISTDLVEALVGKTHLKTELPQAEGIPTCIFALINMMQLHVYLIGVHCKRRLVIFLSLAAMAHIQLSLAGNN
jgi:hypothetical protein